jgi:hypothetical protein
LPWSPEMSTRRKLRGYAPGLQLKTDHRASSLPYHK